jgi:hypothetical protein
MKYYLSGAITSQPDFKGYFKDYFDKLSKLIKWPYDSIFNPAGVAWPEDVEWVTCMKFDIKWLMDSDCLVLLPNWKKSSGVKVEKYLCRKLGIRIVKFKDLVKELTANAS